MNLAQAFYLDEDGHVVLRPGIACGALAYEAARCPPIVMRAPSQIVPHRDCGEAPEAASPKAPARDPGRRGLRTGVPRRALEALAPGAATAQQVADYLDADRKVVLVALNALREMGFVVTRGGGEKPQRHEITEKGRRELKLIKAQREPA